MQSLGGVVGLGRDESNSFEAASCCACKGYQPPDHFCCRPSTLPHTVLPPFSAHSLLDGKGLAGSIPVGAWALPDGLQRLSLAQNTLSGPLPLTFPLPAALNRVDLSGEARGWEHKILKCMHAFPDGKGHMPLFLAL